MLKDTSRRTAEGHVTFQTLKKKKKKALCTKIINISDGIRMILFLNSFFYFKNKFFVFS